MKRITVKNLEQMGRAVANLQYMANPKGLKVIKMANDLVQRRRASQNIMHVSIHSHGTVNQFIKA